MSGILKGFLLLTSMVFSAFGCASGSQRSRGKGDPIVNHSCDKHKLCARPYFAARTLVLSHPPPLTFKLYSGRLERDLQKYCVQLAQTKNVRLLIALYNVGALLVYPK